LNNSFSKNKIQPEDFNTFNPKKSYQKPIVGSSAYSTSRARSFYLTNYWYDTFFHFSYFSYINQILKKYSSDNSYKEDWLKWHSS